MQKEKIKQLFARYEAAFNVLDFRKNAELFADNFISAGPRGVIAQSRQDFLDKAETAATFYKSIGQTSARILDMHETPISDDYTLVYVKWGATFRKTGDDPLEFEVSYIVQHGDEPRIILFITHQDEQEAMQKLKAEEAEF